MTIRDPAASAKETSPDAGAKPAGERVTRPETARGGPHRNGAAAHPAYAPPPCSTADGEPAAAINEAVAQAVKSSYDVLAQTIAQGRHAAERFRQGEYPMREVPHDIEAMAHRLIDLARQVTDTTFDICEHLLHTVARVGSPPPPGQVQPTPPFPDYTAAPPSSAGAQTVGQAPPGPMVPLHVRFSGTAKAQAHTSQLARPARPTLPGDISVFPLAPLDGSAKPLDKITLEADAAHGGLIVTVTVPPGQAPGSYAGIVVAKGQGAPLGTLVIELAD